MMISKKWFSLIIIIIIIIIIINILFFVVVIKDEEDNVKGFKKLFARLNRKITDINNPKGMSGWIRKRIGSSIVIIIIFKIYVLLFLLF